MSKNMAENKSDDKNEKEEAEKATGKDKLNPEEVEKNPSKNKSKPGEKFANLLIREDDNVDNGVSKVTSGFISGTSGQRTSQEEATIETKAIEERSEETATENAKDDDFLTGKDREALQDTTAHAEKPEKDTPAEKDERDSKEPLEKQEKKQPDSKGKSTKIDKRSKKKQSNEEDKVMRSEITNKTTLVLEKEVHRRLKVAAAYEERKVNDIVEELIIQYLEKKKY